MLFSMVEQSKLIYGIAGLVLAGSSCPIYWSTEEMCMLTQLRTFRKSLVNSVLDTENRGTLSLVKLHFQPQFIQLGSHKQE